MSVRATWLALALLPLLLTGLAVAWVVNQRTHVLTELHLSAIEPVLLAARQAELQGKLNLGRSAIQHLVRDGLPDAAAQTQALALLRRLEFGHDNAFFVHDFQGRTLLAPRGQGGDAQAAPFPVDALLAQARAGGGHLSFDWRRPSNGRLVTQLVYVEPIAGWEWMLGTGSFIDDLEAARARLQRSTEPAIADTLGRIAAVLLLSVLLVSAGALLLNLHGQRRADARLRALAAQLVHSQEDERARVARELHDGVQQSLVSVKFLFESVQASAPAGALADRLDEGVVRLREVLGEVRGIAHDLRPTLLDTLGLREALTQLAQGWSERSGLPVHLDLVDPGPLPEALGIALFRFAQEALGNVERHAQARSATLSLWRDAEGLRLSVQDDGQGFDPEAALRRAGLGLTHLRERVEMLGGRLVLRSGPQGSYVGAFLPARSLEQAP